MNPNFSDGLKEPFCCAYRSCRSDIQAELKKRERENGLFLLHNIGASAERTWRLGWLPWWGWSHLEACALVPGAWTGTFWRRKLWLSDYVKHLYVAWLPHRLVASELLDILHESSELQKQVFEQIRKLEATWPFMIQPPKPYDIIFTLLAEAIPYLPRFRGHRYLVSSWQG